MKEYYAWRGWTWGEDEETVGEDEEAENAQHGFLEGVG